MIRNIIFSIVLTVGLVAYTSPIKSMLAANETGYISRDDSPLPDGIIAVEYIESTGTQFIDTGYVPDSTTGFSIDCQCVSYNDGCVGVYQNMPPRFFYFCFYNRSIFFRYGMYNPSGVSTGLDVFGINRIEMSGGSCFINGIEVFSGIDTSALDQLEHSFGLFAYTRNGNRQGYTKMRCFGFQMNDSNGEVFNMIPVRAEVNGTWVGAMYDFVSGSLFYNNGTGDFTIGPDKEM